MEMDQAFNWTDQHSSYLWYTRIYIGQKDHFLGTQNWHVVQADQGCIYNSGL